MLTAVKMYWPVGIVVKDIVIGAGVLGLVSWAGQILRSVSQPLATSVTFLQSCVAQALSSGDGTRHSFHTLIDVMPRV